MASLDFKQPSSMHPRSTICWLRRACDSIMSRFFLSHVSLSRAAAVATIGTSRKWADDCPRKSCLSLGRTVICPNSQTFTLPRRRNLAWWSIDRSTSYRTVEKSGAGQSLSLEAAVCAGKKHHSPEPKDFDLLIIYSADGTPDGVKKKTLTDPGKNSLWLRL